MNKLKKFYETTQQRVPFNELSVESMDILEQSCAYKRYCRSFNYRETISKAVNAANNLSKAMRALKRQNLISNLKYIGNVLICATAAILLVMLFLNEVLKQM